MCDTQRLLGAELPREGGGGVRVVKGERGRGEGSQGRVGRGEGSQGREGEG